MKSQTQKSIIAILVLIYFYAHYGFASISAHALAMYTPFLIVVTLAGAPPFMAAALGFSPCGGRGEPGCSIGGATQSPNSKRLEG